MIAIASYGRGFELGSNRMDTEFERARNRSVALKLLARDGSDVIVCDDRIAEKNDYEFIREVRRIEPDTSIILTTEVDAFRQASNALSAGGRNCLDYVTQLTSPDKIEQLIKQAIDLQRTRYRTRALSDAAEDRLFLESRSPSHAALAQERTTGGCLRWDYTADRRKRYRQDSSRTTDAPLEFPARRNLSQSLTVPPCRRRILSVRSLGE